jgi:peroxiredoxin
MKRISGILVLMLTFVIVTVAYSGDKKLPSVKLKNLKGETVNVKDFSNDGKPFIINFWATWCKPCILELNNINDVYEKWQKETGVKIYAVSIDDSRNSKKVAPFVKGRDWKYEVMLDENSDLRRAFNVNNPPHTLLFNGAGELVYEHNGYAQGDEDELYKKVKELTKTK